MPKKSKTPAPTLSGTAIAQIRKDARRYILAVGAARINVALTVDERDAINAAKQRARDMLTLVMTTLNRDDALITLSGDDDADSTAAVLTACDIMRESFNAIEDAFHAADERHDAATPAGGAR